jgi:hypothetical protein
MGTLNPEPVVVAIPVSLTLREKARLSAYCEDEVRSVGSWFRHAIRKAWRSRKPPRRQPELMQRVERTGERRIQVWARVTETEYDQLQVLCADEGVWPSIWFRRRMEAQWREVSVPQVGRKRRRQE